MHYTVTKTHYTILEIEADDVTEAIHKASISSGFAWESLGETYIADINLFTRPTQSQRRQERSYRRNCR